MKKTYIIPSVEVIKVGATSMLAASVKMFDKEVDTTSEDGQLGREDNPSRPNIWEQGW